MLPRFATGGVLQGCGSSQTADGPAGGRLSRRQRSTMARLTRAVSALAGVTSNAYACPNVATHDRRVNGWPIPSRIGCGPGHDPVQLPRWSPRSMTCPTRVHRPDRAALRNYGYAEVESWVLVGNVSSTALRGANRSALTIRLARRTTPEIGVMREGTGSSVPDGLRTSRRARRCPATVSIDRDGTAIVAHRATDIEDRPYHRTQVTANCWD